ncbi:sortase [Peptoniphilus lacrimalis]|uniref:Sortase family protein n=1 Tax=Peptoniphilus lacrimalis 315-B TaxID=596330 RepID=D1VTZ1_9FIRM|nr:sortase [Peptoniphilus lacrimalis]EFA89975.1 sortase family protein [Peptoniphilus lacrimalis 315-B]
MIRRNIYFYFGGTCILIALIFLTHNVTEDYKVNESTKKIVSELKESVENDSNQQNRYIDNPKMEMPIKQINGYDYIGYLRIEKLSLDLPIMSEWSYPLIRISPARFKGSIYENNMIILAHNYKAHFGYLYKLDRGDMVEFVDMDNNHFIYKVEEVEKINGDKMEELLSGVWDLTLFTCTLGGKSRVVVRCKIQK